MADRYPATRPYYDVHGKVLAQDFSGAAHATTGVTSEVEDTVNVRTGTVSRKFTGTDMNIDYLFDKQTLGDGLGLWFYMPAGSTYLSVTVYIADNAGGFGAGHFAYAAVSNIDGAENALEGTSARSGWNFLRLKPHDFTLGTPSIAYSDIDTVRIKVIGGAHTITLDGMYVNMRARAKCAVFFDDAPDDIMGADVQDYMSARDIKGTVYVTKNLVDQANYVSTANLEDLYTNDGWDVGNHLVDHTAPTGMTDAAYSAAVTECTAFLNANGWTRGANHLAYPTGAFERGNHDVVAKNLGMKTARSIQATLINYHNTEPYNLHYLWAKGVTSAVSAADLIAKIDQAIEMGQTVMLYFHGFAAVADDPSLKWPIADFQTVMDYLAFRRDQGLIDPLTISEWHEGLENGSGRS